MSMGLTRVILGGSKLGLELCLVRFMTAYAPLPLCDPRLTSPECNTCSGTLGERCIIRLFATLKLMGSTPKIAAEAPGGAPQRR